MAATDIWLPAYDGQLSYNSQNIEALTLEYREQQADFETTNTRSLGDHEFGVAETTRSIRWSSPIKDGVTYPARGALVDAIYSDSLETHTGKARVTSKSKKAGGKGGYTWDFEAKFTGAVVTASVP